MKVAFVGDIHGQNINMYDMLAPNVIQVGDLDLYGYKNWQYDEGKRFFIDGNHDNFNKLDPNAEQPYEVEPGLIYIPRGFVSGNVMFFGGADSIDKQARLKAEASLPRLRGKTWHWQEQITDDQLERAKNNSTDIEVIVAHDVPDFVTKKMCEMKRLGAYYDLDSGRKLARLFSYKMPKLWIAGHYHMPFETEMHGCRFVCLNIDEVREFDIPLGSLIQDE